MSMVIENKVQAVIARLELDPKQGESYDHKGRHGWANPIRQDTGPLLEILTLARCPTRVLEIGTAKGLSGCYIARNLLRGAQLVTIEWDDKRAAEASQNFLEAGLPVEVRVGDAMHVIKQLSLLRPFEMVFMDANKDGYLEQIQLLQKLNLLAPNCLIVADNVIDRQTECQNFLDWMEQYPNVLYPTECGLLVGVI